MRDKPEHQVDERVASGQVHVRRPAVTVRSSASVRRGGLLAGLVIAIVAIVVLGGLVSGDPGQSADPGTSAMAMESGPSPGPTTSPAAPGQRRIEASIVQVESCLLPDSFVPPTARVLFEVTWDSELPIYFVEMGLDGVAWSWYGQGDVAASGTYKHSDYPTVGAPHVVTAWFYEDTGEDRPGPLVLEVDAPVHVNPVNPCYPDESEPPPTAEPPLQPAQNGDVIAIVPPGEGDDRIQVQVEVIDQCRSDGDTAMVTLRISWQGTRPIDRVHGDIGSTYDGYRHENELGADGRLGSTDAYERTVNVRVGRRLWVLLGFYAEALPEEPDELHNGMYLAEAYGPALFEPQNPCPA